MNAFEYIHSSLGPDVRTFAIHYDLGPQIRNMAYDQILLSAKLRETASVAIGFPSDNDWSFNDIPLLIELIRSGERRERGSAATLLAILWACRDTSSVLSITIECLLKNEENSQSPVFANKVEVWLDSIESNVKSTLSDLAFC